MPTVEERMDSLESILGQFIVHTDTALRRLEREMQEFKDEMRAFREESERDRKALHEEMKAFRDEMRAFREESERDRKALQEEMKDFKDEMREFKDEMREFKNEMREFKDEMRQQTRDLNKKWGELANKMGTLVEDIVAPNIPRVAREYFGCEDIDFFAVRVEKRDKKRNLTREFDTIAVCGNKVILNETKSTPRQNYLKEFAEFVKKGEFFKYFPEYKGMELIPIFSSLYLTETVVKYLTKNKIYAMAMKNDTMDILNPDLKLNKPTKRK